MGHHREGGLTAGDERVDEVSEWSRSDADDLVRAAVINIEQTILYDRAAGIDDTGLAVIFVGFVGREDGRRGAIEHLCWVFEVEEHRAELVAVWLPRVHGVIEDEPAVFGPNGRWARAAHAVVPDDLIIRCLEGVGARECLLRECREIIGVCDTHMARVVADDAVEDGEASADLLGKEHPILIARAV